MRAAQEQQAAEKGKRALQKGVQALAGKCRSKVAPVLCSLAEIVQNPSFPSLPKIAQNNCNDMLEKLQVWDADAQEPQADKTATTSTLSFDDLCEDCSDATVVRHSLGALLNIVSKF